MEKMKNSKESKVARKIVSSLIRANSMTLSQEAKDSDYATFNGEDIEEIKDPNGGKIDYKFHTEAGSVYIMSENQMSQRLKSEQGNGDAGIHDWFELIVFTQNSCHDHFGIEEFRQIEDALVHNRFNDDALKRFGKIEKTPTIGYSVFEIKQLGEKYPKYHPGHEVIKIDWKR